MTHFSTPPKMSGEWQIPPRSRAEETAVKSMCLLATAALLIIPIHRRTAMATGGGNG